MRAVAFHEYGGPEVLQLVDLPEPQAGPGEVRIRVHAAAVNPTDVLLRTGGHATRMSDRTPPFVPGMDAAGVIDQLGPDGDSRLAVGQQVVAMPLFTGPHGGAYAEQVVVAAESVVPAPARVDLYTASTLLMNAMTARVSLSALNLPRAGTVAITGAAGAVGGYAVELAVADGLTVIADASPDDIELVRGFGAAHVVERGHDVASRITEIIPTGVPGLVDASMQRDAVLAAVAAGGTLVELQGWAGPAERDITVRPVMVAPGGISDTEGLDELARRAENGGLTMRVADVLAAHDAPKAHRMLEAGGLRGRLVLDFS